MAYDKTVFLPIDPDSAFDLLTQPERLRRWCTVAARVDLRLGGEFLWTVTPGNNAMGTIARFEPGKCVSYTWGWVGDPDLQPGMSIVTITLEPVAGGTNVRFIHDGLTKEQEVGHAEGWDHFLGRLVEYTTSGKAIADPWNAAPENMDEIKGAYASLAISQLALHEVKSSELLNSTLCSEFNLGQLIDHQYQSIVNIAQSLGIDSPTNPDPSSEVRLADLSQKILETFQSRGLEGRLILTSYDLTALDVINILNIELLIHGVDIARAINQRVDVSTELAEYVLTLTRKIVTPQLRESGPFGAEIHVAQTQDALTRLLAFTGRAI